ncbi:MAG: translation initiation factor IF-2 N-terminal domain-containing protein, partial [Anaerolineae bacterium]
METKEGRKVVTIPDLITVRQLAELLGVSPIEVIKELIADGIMANINQTIDYDTAAV